MTCLVIPVFPVMSCSKEQLQNPCFKLAIEYSEIIIGERCALDNSMRQGR